MKVRRLFLTIINVKICLRNNESADYNKYFNTYTCGSVVIKALRYKPEGSEFKAQ
jgi:hypothetical protein